MRCSARAEVEGTDGDNFTALLVAARWNRAEMCRYLIEKQSANIGAVNKEGDNAYNLAIAFGHNELAAYLKVRPSHGLPAQCG